MSCTTSLGVKCSPASSLFSSLKRRMSSSKTVPMPWLSRSSRRTVPSPFRMGLGLRLIELSRNFSSRKPSASASTRVGIWLRNLKLLQDLLDVGREAVEVRLEVGPQLLLPPPGCKVAQPEGRRIVEGFAGRLAQCPVLVRNAGVIQRGLHAEYRVLRRFQNRVKPANDSHGQDDVAVLTPDVNVAQHVVRDTPDEAADVQGGSLASPGPWRVESQYY